MKTKRTIITGALRELRVVDFVESPPAEDYDIAARRYDAVLVELRDMGLAYWANTGNDTEEIPDILEVPLIDLLAGRLARIFGKEEGVVIGENGRPLAQSAHGLKAIRRHIAKRVSGEATPFSSY